MNIYLIRHAKDDNRYRRGWSDLPRTLSTASKVSKKLDIRIELDKDLREMNNGDLAGILNKEAFENVAIYKLNCEGKLEFEIENYNDFLKEDYKVL